VRRSKEIKARALVSGERQKVGGSSGTSVKLRIPTAKDVLKIAVKDFPYPRSLITRVGKLELRVPQDRNGRSSTEVFERYQRSEKALVAALTEMYIQGVATRKVKRSAKSSVDTVLARAR
jgi:transposase-like protein